MFFLLFCLMIEGSVSGSVSLTNGSGFGSGRPKKNNFSSQMTAFFASKKKNYFLRVTQNVGIGKKN
jgi:hypothetical protein